jgi:hypothetical protein
MALDQSRTALSQALRQQRGMFGRAGLKVFQMDKALGRTSANILIRQCNFAK